MPPAMRRKILMQSYRAQMLKKKRKGKPMIVDISEIEIASSNDGVTRVLVASPKPCGVCGEPRTMFVCRTGKTRCYICDEGFLKAEAAMIQGVGTGIGA